jgi:hypothetical protein
MSRLICSLAVIFLLAATAPAGEKKLMHCFAFAPVKTATQADWNAFYKATDELPTKIKGITKVWYGKLARPTQGEEGRSLEYGVCMEMANEQTLRSYASDPAHDAWMQVYSKVRVEGTTTFDVVGQ